MLYAPPVNRADRRFLYVLLDEIRNAVNFAEEALALPTADQPNLSDPAVQKRLATQWGYVLPTAAPGDQRDKADAERYRWLADCNNYYEAIKLIADGSLTEDALGEAIDAAIRARSGGAA